MYSEQMNDTCHISRVWRFGARVTPNQAVQNTENSKTFADVETGQTVVMNGKQINIIQR